MKLIPDEWPPTEDFPRIYVRQHRSEVPGSNLMAWAIVWLVGSALILGLAIGVLLLARVVLGFFG